MFDTFYRVPGSVQDGSGWDLPEMTEGYPEVVLIPILPEVRGVGIVLKKWMRTNRLPDAIVLEHSRYAGGHLGAPNLQDIGNARFDFPGVLEGVFQLFKELDIER